MCTTSISRVSIQDYYRPQRLPKAGNLNGNDTSIFGDNNKVNSPTIIINNGGDNGINSCCGRRQQNGIMQMFAMMMASMMQMFAQLLGNNQGCQQQNPFGNILTPLNDMGIPTQFPA